MNYLDEMDKLISSYANGLITDDELEERLDVLGL